MYEIIKTGKKYEVKVGIFVEPLAKDVELIYPCRIHFMRGNHAGISLH